MMARLAARLYRAILLLYPESLQDRVGDDMVDCFEDLLEEAYARDGALGVVGATARTLREVPGSLWEAHRRDRRQRTKGGGGMDSWIQDARFAVRGLVKNPGFTVLAVASLGLGVGANTSMYSLVEATLWTPLPVHEADRLVRVKEVRETASEVSYGNYSDLVAEVDAFDAAALHVMESFALVSDQMSQVAHGEITTSNYFDVLEIEPAAGRFFSPSQHEAPESPLVAVISHYLWTTAFGADPGIIGSAVELNQHPATIIGVAPESFNGTKFGLSLDIWVPIRPWRFAEGWTAGWEQSRSSRSLLMLARLSPGATMESANAALTTMSGRLEEEYPQQNTGMTLRAYPEVAGQIAADQAALPNLVGLIAILGSGLVLLVACGNVASLLMARAVARRQEIGVRVALGAGRMRLIRQLLTESIILAGLGAIIGTGIASWVARLDTHLLPKIPFRFSIDASPDLETVLFAATVSLLAVFVFGLVPALQASSPGISGVLRGDDNAGGLRVRGSKLLSGVVVGVVSLSFVTLFLAGLFTASLQHVRTMDPGFAQKGRVMAILDFGLAGYNPAGAVPLYEELRTTIAARPEIGSVAFASSVPLGDFSSSSRVYADDREYALDEPGAVAWYSALGPGWIELSEMHLLGGRSFTPQDDADAPPVVIINEALARTFWPGEEALGRRIRYGRQPGGTTFEIVGVVATAKYRTMTEAPRPAMFRPLLQSPQTLTIVMAESMGEPGSAIAPLRSASQEVDASIVLFDAKTIEQHWSNAYSLFRMGAELGLAIGLLAALLAAGGLYGIMVFRVGQQQRELGIRVALGAGRGRVLRHVMRGSMTLVGWGLAIGAVVAFGASGVMESVIFGIEPRSPTYLVAVGILLTTVAALATLAPALGATRANPVEAIKTE